MARSPCSGRSKRMAVARFGPIIDPLYGEITPNGIIRDVLAQPELQRLRDVRLSNIDSVSLPGCAGVSRFEHSLGTAHLATYAAGRMRLGKRETAILTLAALLHDIGITPFGHLMEEAFRYAGRTFDHEQRLSEIFRGDAGLGSVHYQIFRGREIGTKSVLSHRDWADLRISLPDVFQLIRGETALGALISGTVDLDNIDNVCRMAYHIGLRFPFELPVSVAAGFFVERNKLCFDEESVPALEEWFDLRQRLYSVLMTSPTDFAAKAMMVEAIRRGVEGCGNVPPALQVEDWRLTDTELQQRLSNYGPSQGLMDRLTRGDLFSRVGMFWVETPESQSDLFSPERSDEHRVAIAKELGTTVRESLVYVIKDKRVRKVDNLCVGRRGSAWNAQPRVFGRSSRLVLFGVVVERETSLGRDAESRLAAYLEGVSGATVRPCRINSFREEITGLAHEAQLPLL